MPYYKMQSRDKSGEPTSFKVNLPDVTPANFDAVVGSDLTTFIGLVEDLSLSEWKDVDLISEEYLETATLPTDPYAQREVKGKFTYVATGGRKGSVAVPAPDLDDMAQPGTDVINMADTEVAAYKSALETYAVSRDGAAITVIGGKIVGRNI